MAKLHIIFLLFVSCSIRSIFADTCPPSAKKLFVFGDSYLDTGNGKYPFGPWVPPFGASMGQPSGRFSDGLVWTDLLAQLMGIDSPTPMARVDTANATTTRSGVNIAFGGAGLYPTAFMPVSMRVQMDFLEDLMKKGVFTKCDLNNSLAFISISGNDYSAYADAAFPFEKNVAAYTVALVAQLAADVQMLHLMGIGKVAVAALPPLGCLPEIAADSDYPGSCNQKVNEGARRHNDALRAAVDALNMVNGEKSIAYVDFYRGFSDAMDEHVRTATSKEYANPTKRCCIENGGRCGDVDKEGKPLYKFCDQPLQSFFFDGAHPAQHGWALVFAALKDDMKKILA